MMFTLPTTPNNSEAEQAPTKPVKANGADYSVHPEPGQLAAPPLLRNHRRGRRLPDCFSPGEYARIRPAPAAVLAVSDHHDAGLCAADTGGKNVVYSQVWGMMAVVGPVAGYAGEILNHTKPESWEYHQ